MRFYFFKVDKRGIAISYIGYILLALGALVIGFLMYKTLLPKNIATLEYIKNLFKWG
jgi:Ni,Fe-hydrogenase I cytochrome b subunit